MTCNFYKRSTKNTEIFSIDNPNDLRRAARIIACGGLVAFPTETVYGLGANGLDKKAVKEIFVAKGRPQDNPLILHIDKLKDLDLLVDWNKFQATSGTKLDVLKKVLETLWPGPLTIVLPKSELVPEEVSAGLESVAIRMPDHEVALRLIEEAGVPIAAPSANLSGRPSPTCWTDVQEDLDGRIDGIVAGNVCDVGIESTVLDVSQGELKILRPGKYTREMLEKAFGSKVVFHESILSQMKQDNKGDMNAAKCADDLVRPASPGMKYRHYAPKAQLILLNLDNLNEKEKNQYIAKIIGTMPSSGDKGDNESIIVNNTSAFISYTDANEATHKFFADLRELDRRGIERIYVLCLKAEGLGISIMNRMIKASGGRIETPMRKELL